MNEFWDDDLSQDAPPDPNYQPFWTWQRAGLWLLFLAWAGWTTFISWQAAARDYSQEPQWGSKCGGAAALRRDVGSGELFSGTAGTTQVAPIRARSDGKILIWVRP